MANSEDAAVRTPLHRNPAAGTGLHVRGNGHPADEHVPRRGSIRVLLSQTSKALGLPFNESTDTPEKVVSPPNYNRAFQFQRQATNSSLNPPHSPNSISSLERQETGNFVNQCCKKYISRLIAHFILILVLGGYVLMGTLLYVYVIGPEEEMFEQQWTSTPFDVDAVMSYLRSNVMAPALGKNITMRHQNLEHFQSYLKHRIKAAGIYENKRDFSAVSGILYSVSIISGIGKRFAFVVMAD